MFIAKSSEVANVLSAFVKAKKEIGSITKGAKNPFFKSKYADLSAILNEVEPVLAKHGLAVMQPVAGYDGSAYACTTLVHESGEYVTILGSELVAAKQNDPQAMGSAITYARRYSISSAFSLNAENDDDGERAMNRGNLSGFKGTSSSASVLPFDKIKEFLKSSKNKAEDYERIISSPKNRWLTNGQKAELQKMIG